MMKTVLLLDLDNTIYPVSSIGDKLFKTLFATIEKSGEFEGNFEAIKAEIQRTPFQKVAYDFSFTKKLLNECMNIHIHLTYDDPMFYFDDYSVIRNLPHKKYLVTSGFTKLQNSKIKQLGIFNDFEEIHIIDLQTSVLTKKDIFQKIIEGNNFQKNEVLVIGDDINSEIKAGSELDLKSVLYDRKGKFLKTESIPSIATFHEIHRFI
ncbi:HAD family hydrolase [Prolixibacteraceae bacterium Z1-6]|uniref:HAD family hydrolase n=1 Tax=Draconibacterium aestuarii TaxID=2998507 RepID=A0A9X3F895_9BACT|nr:HAD family hydrolase [Prolixibacteraceae bacterium Z1-6]